MDIRLIAWAVSGVHARVTFFLTERRSPPLVQIDVRSGCRPVCAGRTVARERNRIEPQFADGLSAMLAAAESSLVNASQGIAGFFDQILFIFKQCGAQFLQVGFRSDVCHMHWRIRQASISLATGLR
jgi:hypothetical protein